MVGGGGSGLAAAISAAQHGGRVLVLEKRPQPGGTTGIAVGSFTAAGTTLQQQAGVSDDPRMHVEDVANFAPDDIEPRNNDELRAFFLEEAAATLEWIQGFGLHFVGPHPEPPNRQPRMHNVVPGAKAYIAAMQLALQRLGGELVCDAEVESLLEEDGVVRGVVARVAGESQRFEAQRGVILAGGDYANNPDVIAKFKGGCYETIDGINPHATGGGHQLAMSAGAQMVNMDVTYGPELRFVPANRRPFQQWLPVSGWRARWMGAVARRLPASVMRRLIKRLLVTWQHPENALFDDGAILLNSRGERFVDEKSWPEREIAVSQQPEKIAYLLLDERLHERYSAWPHFISTAPDIAYAYVADYLRLRADVATAGTLDDVLRVRGVDSSTARASIEMFNRYASGEADDPLGRQGDQQPLAGERWVLLGPVKAYFTTTEGGAAVNQRLQVLNDQGDIIPHLYAVGQNGLGGMVLWSHGLHIAWALTSGRLAGAAVMA